MFQYQQLQYTKGVLGNGCYLRASLSQSGLLRCQLPVAIVLELMDCGTWQSLVALPADAPVSTVIDCYWRADQDAIERAILRLRQHPENDFKKRLARVLTHSLPAQLEFESDSR